MLNAFKFKYMEGPLKKFYEDFAAASESNGSLTSDEIQKLNEQFNAIINAANSQFQQLEQVSGLNFGLDSNSTNANSLQGAVKNITEESAQLLAGSLGGIRLTGVNLLNVATQQLDKLNSIQFNTANTVNRIERMESTMIDFFQNRGIKLK